MFDKLIELAAEKWRSTFFIMFLLFVFGIYGYSKIPKESNPEVVVPFIQIRVTYKGVSPFDGERMMIKPLERELKSLSGVKNLNCTASFGSVSCSVEFVAGSISIEKALNDVRDRVNIAKADFPIDAEEPFVQEYDINKEQPVLVVQIMGDASDDTMIKIGDDLKDKITSLKEVLDVELYGTRDHSVEILIKPETISQYNLDISDFNNIRTQNAILIGGLVRNGDGEYKVQIPGLLETITEIMMMPIKFNSDSILRVNDVARVKKTYKDRTSYARINGQRAVTINVSKRSGENIISTVEKIRKVVDEYAENLPSNIFVIYTNDESDNIKESLLNLNNNIVLSVIIVFFIVLNMIGLRQSFFIMVTIPLTFLMGVMFLYFAGYTMNVVVLFSLVLGTGMIVDASIVMIEYTDLLLKDGVPYKEAFIRSAKRMFIPIFSAVVTVLIVATPLLFWPGVPGQFMKYLPLTLIALLSSSFIVAIFFLPTIGTKFGSDPKEDEHHKEMSFTELVGIPIKSLLLIKGMFGIYINMVWTFLNNPKKTFAGLLVFITLITIVYGKFNNGTEFFPTVESNFATIRVRSVGNLSLEEKDKIIKIVEERVKDMPEIKYYQATTFTSTTTRIGRINVEFYDWRIRRKAKLIIEDIKEKVKDIPGVEITVELPKSGPGASSAITLNIVDKESEPIEQTLKMIKNRMTEDGNFTDIYDNANSSKIQISVNINRIEAARYGIDINAVGSFVSLAADGFTVSDYRPSYSDDKVDIVVRFPPENRSLEDIKSIKVPSKFGYYVPISSFADVILEKETTSINRLNQKRVITLTANVREGVVESVKIKELFEWIIQNKKILPAEVKFGGNAEEQEEVVAFLAAAFSTAIIIMMLLFLMQFNSLGKTLIVIFAIFLSIFGVFAALLISGLPFGIIMCGIAVIALAGIVVDSSILFIETFKDLEEKNLEIKEALLKSAIIRLKPILLASMTTVAGMIPMIFSLSIDFVNRDITFGAPSSAMWKPLATSIAGGLTFVVILTIFITPAIILLEETLKAKIKGANYGKIFKIFKRSSFNYKF